MRMVRFFAVAAVWVLAGCTIEEITHETGHKGRARLNPWLAAERFVESYDLEVRSLTSWQEPDYEDLVWFVPGFILSNESFTRRMEEWVMEGGHAVVLVEYSDAQIGDWSEIRPDPGVTPALEGMLERAGIKLGDPAAKEISAERIEYLGREYEVNAAARIQVIEEGKEPGMFASVPLREGRLTVIADARIFRNRWIGEKEHADLLYALADGEYDGAVVFLKGSTMSLWTLLGRHLWPVLVSLGVLVLLWLWKNLARFGPLDSEESMASVVGYDQHLESLGDFQWRLDKCSALLAPLREQLAEHGQHLAARTGHRDMDFFQFLADRTEIPRERVFRALAEAAPADPAILVRTTADLQRISQALNQTSS